MFQGYVDGVRAICRVSKDFKDRQLENSQSFEVKMCSTKEMYHYEVSDQSQMNGRTASTAWLPEAGVLSNLIIYDMELKHQNIQEIKG